MSIRQIERWEGSLSEGDPPGIERLHSGRARIGHAHFWERAMSRRQFVKTATGAAGIALGAGLLKPEFAHATRPGVSDPRPIPGGIQIPGLGFFHVFAPEAGEEPSTITDFNGSVGVAHIMGEGTGTGTRS